MTLSVANNGQSLRQKTGPKTHNIVGSYILNNHAEKYFFPVVVVDLKAVKMNLVLWVDGNSWTQDIPSVPLRSISI